MIETPSSPLNNQGPAAAASAPGNEPAGRRIPSRGWYGLAFVVMLIGVAAFVASVNVARAQVDASLNSMQRLVAPGSAELAFTQPGDYLVYYEKVGTFNGEDFDTTRVFREAPALHIELQNLATGEFINVRQAKLDASETQMFNHGQANSEFVFTLPPEDFSPPEDASADAARESGESDASNLTTDSEAGEPVRYTMTVAHENEDIEDRVLLAVGPPVVGTLMSDWRGPFGGAAVLAFAFVISATTVLVTWMLRHGKVTRREE